MMRFDLQHKYTRASEKTERHPWNTTGHGDEKQIMVSYINDWAEINRGEVMKHRVFKLYGIQRERKHWFNEDMS